MEGSIVSTKPKTSPLQRFCKTLRHLEHFLLDRSGLWPTSFHVLGGCLMASGQLQGSLVSQCLLCKQFLLDALVVDPTHDLVTQVLFQ